MAKKYRPGLDDDLRPDRSNERDDDMSISDAKEDYVEKRSLDEFFGPPEENKDDGDSSGGEEENSGLSMDDCVDDKQDEAKEEKT